MRTHLCALALLTLAVAAHAEEPQFKVGATIFADYTQQEATSSFTVSRAYLNVTGNLSKRLVFRITPDVAREAGSGSSLNGSQQFRLKYAYAQLALDEWLTKGSLLRFGVQQTPFLDHTDAIYRYRFQGTTFVEREGYLSSSDTGIAMRYVLPSEYGDVHAGVYNGEGYNKTETNDEKAFQIRATLRPLPKSPLGKGLRVTAFYDADHYDEHAPRNRAVGEVTYEHARFHAGVDVLATNDRNVHGRGSSVFATPRLGRGWELLLRHDRNRPDRDRATVRQRTITGVAYWMPDLQKMTCAVLVDRDALSVTGKPDDTRYGVKLLLVF